MAESAYDFSGKRVLITGAGKGKSVYSHAHFLAAIEPPYFTYLAYLTNNGPAHLNL